MSNTAPWWFWKDPAEAVVDYHAIGGTFFIICSLKKVIVSGEKENFF